VHVNNAAPSTPANALLLGNNIEWVAGGDGVLLPGSLQFNPILENPVVALAPTIIRYPGGAFADVYQWQAGLGTISQRGMLPSDGNGGMQTVYFGSQEFLSLCVATNAQALVTLNVVTATPADAAGWVTLTNITRLRSDSGAQLPTVPFWEIGNEPYLTQNLANLPFTPELYLAQANAIMPAIKAVDPTILAGVPLLGPTEAAFLGANGYAQFNTVVLPGLAQAPDFFAIHDAYLPVGITADKTALYYATVAGANQVQNDLDSLRAQVQQYFPAQMIPFAITEFNSLFTLNLSPTDHYPQSLASAIYIADLFITFSKRTDIMAADYFQFLDGYVLGAIAPSGNPRPGGQVLTAFSKVLKGNLLSTTVQSGAFDAPPVGFFAGLQNVPVISALATQNQNAISLVLINKELSSAQNVAVTFASPLPPSSLTARVLTTADVFQTFPNGGLAFSSIPAPSLVNGGFTILLPPHSITIVQITP
jgi:alpha-N-arabinofuranosidase